MVIGLFVAFGLICFGGGTLKRALDAVRPSGIEIEGRPLSRSEAEAGTQEMMTLLRGGKIGESASFDTSYEPKTELGKKFKALILRRQSMDSAYQKTLGGGDLADLLKDERVATPAGRKRSRAELAEFRTASRDYYAESRAALNEFRNLIPRSTPRALESSQRTDAANLSVESGSAKLADVVESMLDLADREKLTMHKGRLEFETTAGLKRYGELEHRFDQISDELVKSSQSYQAAGQADFDDLLAHE